MIFSITYQSTDGKRRASIIRKSIDAALAERQP